VLLEERHHAADEVEVREEIDKAHRVTYDDVDHRHRRAVIAHDPEPGRTLAWGLAAPPGLEDGKIEGKQKQRPADDDRERGGARGGELQRHGHQGHGEDDQNDDQVVEQRRDHP
jgi:hypothetical protein